MTTVLLVEDDADARSLLSELLTMHGMVVVSVGDGEAAIALLDEGMVPDVVLSDLMMPRVSGTAVLAYLNARPHLCNTRTALVTATPERAPSGTRVFAKPVKVNELLAFLS